MFRRLLGRHNAPKDESYAQPVFHQSPPQDGGESSIYPPRVPAFDFTASPSYSASPGVYAPAGGYAGGYAAAWEPAGGYPQPKTHTSGYYQHMNDPPSPQQDWPLGTFGTGIKLGGQNTQKHLGEV